MKQTIYLCILTVLFAFGLSGGSGQALSAPQEAGAPQSAGTDAPQSAATDAPCNAEAGAPQSAEADSDAERPQTSADLAHKHFVLQSVNGKDFTGKQRLAELQFNDDLRISGGICNRFAGQAALENGVLSAGQLASTRMLCVDEELNQLEQQFGRMLSQGAALAFDGKTLTLKGEGLTLVFALRAGTP